MTAPTHTGPGPSAQGVPVGTSFWHPFADMTAVPQNELVLDRGSGSWIWDADGNRYLDATASLWYANVGHGRRELADAAHAQLLRLAAYSTYDMYANEPVLALAERVCALAPIADAVVFFTTAGSDAIDTAAKIVRRYWTAVGAPKKRIFVVREGCYHGLNGFGTSLAGIDANATGYGELIKDVVRVARDDPADLERALQEHSGEVAAFFGEPVVAAGGVYPPSPGYWEEVQRICREHDVLLVADEVVTGFGRLGRWFGSLRYGFEPDLIVGAKGITSGYVPLGLVLCGTRVQEPFWRGSAGMLRHGYTYSGHATACAVALANLDIIEREQLIDRVASLEPLLSESIGTLAAHPLVNEVRSVGLMAAVQLSPDALSKDATLLGRVVGAARTRGVLLRGVVGHSLQISPPFVITPDEIELIAQTIGDALESVLHETETGAVASA